MATPASSPARTAAEEHYDAIVIGAGVMGASAAMHLASAGLTRLLVVEKGPGAGSGSTGKSSACIRQTYSNLPVTVMAKEALERFANWQDFTGLAAPKAAFVNCGVLFLFPQNDPAVPAIQALHAQAGVASSLLSTPRKRELFPDLDFTATPLEALERGETGEHEAQALFEHEGGFADPVGTAEDMLAVAQALGASVHLRTAVTAIAQRGGRVSGVTLRGPQGERQVECPLVVSCAGPWSSRMLSLAGVTLPHRIVPIRAQMVSKRFVEPLKGPIPMVVDMMSGFYGRLEANGVQFICGSVREEDELEEVADPDAYNEVADAPFRESRQHLMHHRISTFKHRGDVTSYAGLYTVNQVDYHPIIDRTALEGFIVACGFSGHGFKLSPVVGNLIAQKALGQWGRGSSQVPTSFFDAGRAPLKTNWGGVIA